MRTTTSSAMDIDLYDIRRVSFLNGGVLVQREGDQWTFMGQLIPLLGQSKPFAFADDIKEILVEVLDRLPPRPLVLEGPAHRWIVAGDNLHHLRALCLHDEAS